MDNEKLNLKTKVIYQKKRTTTANTSAKKQKNNFPQMKNITN
jgi:hypothetical protein